jgi:hypothetical protein
MKLDNEECGTVAQYVAQIQSLCKQIFIAEQIITGAERYFHLLNGLLSEYENYKDIIRSTVLDSENWKNIIPKNEDIRA